MKQPTLFDLEAFTNFPTPNPLYDPSWDEIETAPQHPGPETRWNPARFGEVPRKLSDNGQLTIFFDDSDEPPDPDDYLNLDDYEQAWGEWELRVGAQVTSDTTVESCVGAQVSHVTQKVAPQHDAHWVEKYWVKRSGNKYWYYRYCWMLGRKKNRRYIGSVDSITAKQKREIVETAIADGKLPIEIEKLIKGWKHEPSTMPEM
ncbi:Arm DNA-binding domain-containing protein [Nostoc sp.]|uniref:Arm DNA-binding domain-containing protein n=1 Tax=Nostoc sp. TaxID=1180 RepID=UPI002FF5B098